MGTSGIDWERTALAAVVFLVALAGVVVAWKVTKVLLKAFLFLAALGIAAAATVWWLSRH